MVPSSIYQSPYLFSRQVYWLGGSPCSGKSSIAQVLAQRHGLRYVASDDYFYPLANAADPAQQPVMHRIARMSWEEIWMRSVDVLVQDEIAAYREEFPLALAELARLEGSQPLLVEGALLLPELVAPLLDDPSRAVWVVPSPAFQRQYYARRSFAREIVSQTSDPELAFDHWMERDIQFARLVLKQAQDFGFNTLVVDGQLTLAQNTALVEQFFGLENSGI